MIPGKKKPIFRYFPLSRNLEVDFFTPNVAFCVCVTLSRYMRIGENLLNEVPVEKSILVDFDQFITFVNKWKAKWVHEGYSWFKKNTKTTPVSAVLPPSDLLFLLRGQLQGSMKVRSMKVSTNQWHNYGSVHLAIFDHLWVLEIVSGLNSVERTNSEEAERGGGRISEKREKGAMITLILSLLTLFLICETWQFHQNITLKNY